MFRRMTGLSAVSVVYVKQAEHRLSGLSCMKNNRKPVNNLCLGLPQTSAVYEFLTLAFRSFEHSGLKSCQHIEQHTKTRSLSTQHVFEGTPLADGSSFCLWFV